MKIRVFLEFVKLHQYLRRTLSQDGRTHLLIKAVGNKSGEIMIKIKEKGYIMQRRKLNRSVSILQKYRKSFPSWSILRKK